MWTHEEVDLAPHQVVVLCSMQEMRRRFLGHLLSKAWIRFSESASRVQVLQPLKWMELTIRFVQLELVFRR